MSLGGVNRLGPGGGGTPHQGGGTGSAGDSEFSLEQQQAGSTELTKSSATKSNKLTKAKTTKITERSKRNRKGAPRTVLVDGELYEVYLLAIA